MHTWKKLNTKCYEPNCLARGKQMPSRGRIIVKATEKAVTGRKLRSLANAAQAWF